jgi:hypothetical protein
MANLGANPGHRYIRAPTEEECVGSYYISVYGIVVGDLNRGDSGLMTCEVRSIFPLTYYFGVMVNASEIQALGDDGGEMGVVG